MKITLDANPRNAPCCVRIEAENGEDVLFQTDWDWPPIAVVFGWSPVNVQVNGANWEQLGEHLCRHEGSDGTVDCSCGVTAGQFIASARRFIDDHDGAQAEDPGYFD